MKLRLVVIILIIVAVLAAVTMWLSKSPKGEDEPKETATVMPAKADPKPAAKQTAAKRPAAKQSAAKPAARKKLRRVVSELSPEDQRLSDRVQNALDSEDLEQTKASVAAALKSECQEVRMDAVNALGWFQDKALIELTRLMNDKDPEVAELARDHVETALMGMEDYDRAFALAAAYIEVYGENEDCATMLSGVLASAGSQLTEPEDPSSIEDVKKAAGNRVGLVDLIDGLVAKGGAVAESAKEAYESISGEEWTGRAAADNWATDLEVPTEDDDGNESEE